ncbi:MBL fold metallo-hydrolase [Geomesophilobacter sediminis]|uniref:3',5'-cyclic-nucleotide phosphodiesterase n=1 Tax=Geomesophilobacter sediminis TaxID=2798584 RepID=A0A8J7S925_9BACT|nr:3',5'-cyclic-nucleotide phosphodiesterase [Geomesophilobacter sediminis]MBJ6726741.1 3',5'-cyclic-nucleotide phosphodiesterase [Geomesophilobacter sediminis]
MRLRVLGCSGAEFPGFLSSAFLLDDAILLDAGTIGAVLTEEEQWRIRDIFVTHAHLDHIKGIPLLADNVIIRNLQHQVTVHAIPEVIKALREHLMNNVIWPDFSTIPTAEAPVIRYQEIHPGQEFDFGAYRFRATPVNHSVPAVAYTVEKDGARLTYTGDTGPTYELWTMAGALDALIVEVSFPNALEELALLTGHLTCKLLEIELKKMKKLPRRILVTHPKPQYHETIREEVALLPFEGLELLKEGNVYDF